MQIGKIYSLILDKINKYFDLLRTYQYIKNLFILAPLFFSGYLTHFIVLEKTLLSVVYFSLSASGVYIFNDLCDVKEDRKHPTKRNRPIASGSVSIVAAKFLMVFLILISFIGAIFLSFNFTIILAIYVLLNISYSLWLKHLSIVDIIIIAIGFVLRILAGGVVAGVYISMWIILVTFLLALFLAIAKRRDDVLLSQQGKTTRKNIDGYNLEFVNATMVIMASVVVVSYTFYTISEEVEKRLKTHNVYLSVLFVILGILRYMQITLVENNSASPTKILLKDRFMQIVILLWISLLGWFIYK